MELLAVLASGMTLHIPVAPTITTANATVIAIPSAIGHLIGLSHASEALNTSCIAPFRHLAASGPPSGNITAQSHHVVGSPVVLVVPAALCFIDGFLPPPPSEPIVIGLTSWFITSLPGTVVPLWAMFLAAGIGTMLGDSFAFFLSTRILVERIPLLNRGRGKTAYGLTRRTLYWRGTSFIFVACFISEGCIAIDICAGVTNFDYVRFLRTDFIAVMCWMAYGMIIGAVSGEIMGGMHPLFAVAVEIIGRLVLNLVMDRLVSWMQECFWNKPVPGSSGL